MTTKDSRNKTKFWLIEDKKVYFPMGITMENWKKGRKIIVSYTEHGKTRRKSFPWTLAGLEEAKAFNDANKKETKKYGAEFGNITEDEKRALDRYREYIKEAQAHGYGYASAYEIMVSGLENRKTTSPDFNTLARYYFDKELMRKTDGELTEHAETVKNRLFKHICPVLGGKPTHTITEDEVEEFLDGLKGMNGKRASATTRTQYLNLLKSVFKFCIKKKLLPAEYNPVAGLTPPTKKKDKEPEILSVDDVKRIFAFVKKNPKYHKFIPVLAVGFFCGARVEERAKMTYQDIFVCGRNEIYISAAVAKNGIARFIYPTENVKAWMDFAAANGVSMNATDTLIQGDTVKQRRTAHSAFLKALATETGIILPKNCIRHTAASFMSESIGHTAAANQLGHDLAVLMKHYRRAITKTEAEDFYNITPDTV